ncbi:MAG: type II toxin-antitoxin system RelE/ParE family toxin [Patescibacteria group bacterium]|jgi:phage-related protein
MIYNDNQEYSVKYYKDLKTGRTPVKEYILGLDVKQRAKVARYIKLLKINQGYLDEPYSRHISGKIRELRVDIRRSHNRIFYFTFVGKNIILLHAFLKKTGKTPPQEIVKAEQNYCQFIINNESYESYET